MTNEERLKKRASKWELSVKTLKLATGTTLVIAAGLLLLYAIADLVHAVQTGDTERVFETFISDILLVVIMLEIAKTLFTYVENEEMYLHSIMEAAFIAVLRQVILTEIEGISWTDTLGLSALILAMGFVYYRLFTRHQ